MPCSPGRRSTGSTPRSAGRRQLAPEGRRTAGAPRVRRRLGRGIGRCPAGAPRSAPAPRTRDRRGVEALRTLDAIESGVSTRSDNASGVWDWLMSDNRHKLKVPAAAELFERVEVASDVRIREETADELVAHFRTT